ncbi:MAG: LysM peptidoglycan-binding domain-containing protein [Phycisphaerae bacterium]
MSRHLRLDAPRFTLGAQSEIGLRLNRTPLAQLVAAGRLVLVEALPIEPRLAPGALKLPPVIDRVAPPESSTRTGWIKIRIVHHLTGEPFCGVRLIVRTPTGSERDCETDRGGIAAVFDIGSGDCQVSSVLADARSPQTLGFVGTGEVPKREAPQHPLHRDEYFTRATWIAELVEHKVQTGESLDSIARQNGTDWKTLCAFNFGTQNPDEINAALRDVVGCTKKTPDGFNYKFSSEDEPGMIYIPMPIKVAGLATEQTHTLKVKIGAFRLVLENHAGLRIPKADYQVTFSDGSETSGKLGRGGIKLLSDPPPGPMEILYPDLDDIEAKSLAACTRDGFDRRDMTELLRALRDADEIVQATIKMYDQYYNDLSGQGLLADIDQEVVDPQDAVVVEALLRIAGVRQEPVAGGA